MKEVFRSCCAGLDIHQKVIVACVLRSAEGKKRQIKPVAALKQRLAVFLNSLIG